MTSLARAQNTFSENFRGATAPGWIFGANPTDTLPVLTGSDNPADGVDSNPATDLVGDGWLRLNTNTNNQSTYALLDTQIFSVNARIEVTMEYAFWNGTGADGITFFLVDGSIDFSTFRPGAYGGSMGYAQKTDEGGMPGGYLGFALDNFGNYSNGSEGRNGGITNDGTLYPNRVSVRGPASSNYAYIASNTSALAGQMDFPEATTRPDQTGADFRAFKIILDANNQLTVQMKFGASGSFGTAFTADLSAFERPDNFKIGFTGATGGSTEIHEIRNLALVTTPWATGSGAYEWDEGAGANSIVYGGTPGGPNSNWYSSVSGDDNKTPTADSDILFGNRPGLAAGAQNPQLAGDIEVRNMTFDTALNYTVGDAATPGAGGKITFGDTTKAGLPSINVNNYNDAYGLHKINSNIELAEDLAIRNFSLSTLCINGTTETNSNTITVSGQGAVNFNQDISGAGDLVKNGTGITTINNNNSNDPDGAGTRTAWSGAVTVNGGMLVITSDGALGGASPATTLRSYDGLSTATASSLAGIGVGQVISGHSDIADGTLITGSTAAISGISGTVTDGSTTMTVASSAGLAVGQLITTGSGIRDNTYITAINGNTITLSRSANANSTGNRAFSAVVTLAAVASGNSTDTSTTFTGNTTVNSGATLAVRGGVNYTTAETIILNGNGIARNTGQLAGALHNDGGDNTLGSAVSIRLASNSSIGSRDGTLTLSGVVSETGGARSLTKVGAGTVVLGGANTYTGATIIQEGELRLTGTLSASTNLQLAGGVLELGAANYSAALGTGAGQVRFTADGGFSAHGAARNVNLGGGTALTWASTANFLGNNQALLLSSDVSNNTVTFQNAIDLNGGQREFRVANGSAAVDAILSGNLTDTGTGGLIKTGTGTLSLAGTNDYTGATEIRAGALRGNVSANSNLQLNGGVRELSTAASTLTLGNGAGQVRWTGAGGFSAHTNDVTLTLDVPATTDDTLTWGTTANFAAAGSTLRLGSLSSDKTLILANNLNLGATGTRTIQTTQGNAAGIASGRLAGVVAGAANFSVTGNGRLDLTGANTHSGTVTIAGSEVRLTGSGSLASTSGFTVQQGGTLTLDNAGTLVANRIGNTVGITLDGGTLAQIGNAATNIEDLGVLTLAGGANTVRATASGVDTDLRFTSLSRTNGATLDFVRNTGSGNLRFGTAPAYDDNILAYATLNGTDFVGNDTAYPGYAEPAQASFINTGNESAWTTSATNASTGASQTLTAARTINSLKLSGGADIALGANNLTIESGGLLTTGGGTASIISGTGTLSAGANALIVHAYNTVGTEINSTIAGTGGLTKAGSGTLTLGGSTANTQSGVTRVQEGTLVLSKTAGVNAIAGDGNTATTDLIVGDGRGIDVVRLGANEQIADNATVLLRGGEVGNSANVARLELNGAASNNDAARIETFRSLQVTGNSVLDFGGGTVCSPNFLYLDILGVEPGSLLTITNWIEFTDFLLIDRDTFDATQLARVIFDGYPGTASWQIYDDKYYQITPVPEPASYGLLAMGGLVGFTLTRRRRRAA